MALAADLRRMLGDGRVLDGADAVEYQSDATRSRGLRGLPDAVVLPKEEEEVAQVLAWCYERGVAIVPRGGGTGLAGGAVPVSGGVVIALGRLTRVHEISPGGWRMRVGAGVTTATVRRLAAESGLFFPPDPGAAEQSQIGGNAATNAGGPHAFKYGATGAWVTGLSAVIAPGSVVTLGGTLRKDVGLYDLRGLLVGSEGTLGIITSVSLRLLPAPEVVVPVVAFYSTSEQAQDAIEAVAACGVVPAALDFLDGETLGVVARAFPGDVPPDARFALLSEVDGAPEEAERERGEISAALGIGALAVERPRSTELWRWRDGVSLAVATERGGKVSEDIVVPLERLAEAVAMIHALGRETGLPTCAWGHAGDGNIHASFMVDPAEPHAVERANAAAERLFEIAVGLGGGVTGEHGIGWLKRGQLARQWPRETLELHERIKRDLDPRGLLNPGKKLATGPAWYEGPPPTG